MKLNSLTCKILPLMLTLLIGLTTFPIFANALDELQVDTWFEIPNSKLEAINPCPADNCAWSGQNTGFSGIMSAWSGGTFDTVDNRLIVFGGGHQAYYGNDVYGFDLDTLQWEQIIAPSNYAANITYEQAGQYPDGGPIARHTYNSLVFIESQNKFLVAGSFAPSPSGVYGDGRFWTLDFDDAVVDWEQPTVMGVGGGFAGGYTAYNKVTDTVYYHKSLGGDFFKYEPSTNAHTRLGSYSIQYYATAAIDTSRNKMLVLGGYSAAQAFVWDLNPATPTITNLNLNPSFSASSGPELANSGQMGLDYDPINDQFVAWKGGKTIYLIDPVTYQVTKSTLAGADPGGDSGLGTYGRFRYAPSMGGFVLANATDRNVFVFKTSGVGVAPLPTIDFSAVDSSVEVGDSVTLNWVANNATTCNAGGDWSGTKPITGSTTITNLTAAQVYTLTCTGEGGSSTAQVDVAVTEADTDPVGSDWAARSTAPGVLSATRFDSESDVVNWTHAGNLVEHVSYEQGNKASGNGSLRFDILKTDGANSGNWRRWLSDDEREFVEGDEFYVSYRQYVPSYFATHVFKDGGGWKQSIISRNATEMNGVNVGQPAGSNQLNEIVLGNGGYRSLVTGYSRSTTGHYLGFAVPAQTACSSTDFRFQNAVDRGIQSVGTACENDRARYGGLYSFGGHTGTPDPLTGGFIYHPNEWLTFKIYVKLGSQGTRTENSHIKVWAAREGGEFDLITDRDNIDLGDGPAHNTLWLLPYDTGKSPDPTRQDTYTLYDEVIVSLNDIGAPGVTSGVALPTVNLSASSNVVLSGGSVNLNWITTGADSCTASGSWNGARVLNGSEQITNITANKEFILTCINAQGSRSDTVNVAIEVPTSYNIEQSSAADHADSFALDGATVSGGLFAYINPDSDVSEVHFFLDNPNATGTPTGVELVAPYDFSLSGNEAFDTRSISNGLHTLTAKLFLSNGDEQIITVNFTVANEVVIPQPTLNFSANPVTVAYNGFSTLSWSTTNAATCAAGGSWSGNRPTSGSESVGPLTDNATFFLTCSGGGGVVSQPVTVLVTPPEAPQVTISATPNAIDYNGSTTVAWLVSNARTCVASGGWSGAKATAGAETIGPLQANTNLILTCSGPGGNGSAQTLVTVAPIPEPVIVISANPASVSFDGTTTLSWSTSYANSCTATGGWSGSRAVSGTTTVGPLQADTLFGLVCNGDGGSGSNTVTVVVGAAPSPTLSFSVTPASVPFGGSVVAVWNTTNVTSCVASGGWTGTVGPNGLRSFGQLENDLVLTLTCTGPGGTIADTKTVDVAAANPPAITLSASPLTVDYNGASQITWSTTNAESCSAAGAWSGARSVSGAEAVGPLQSTGLYILNCVGAGGTANANVTITVNPAAPTVSLSATPLSIPFNGTTNLLWASTNASSCEASGAWSGSVATNGGQTSEQLSADSTFRITCTSESGASVSDAVTINVAAPGAPSVSFFANPTSVATGGTSALTWSSVNTESCVASGDWSASIETSGSLPVGPLDTTSTFIITCAGTNGSEVSQSVSVQIVAPEPAVTITADPTHVEYDGSTVVTWASTNATTCEAFGAWSGVRPPNGSITLNNVTAATTFALTCQGEGGVDSALTIITVDAPPAPTVTLSSSQQTVDYGGTVDLFWLTGNVSTCQAFGGWSGVKTPEGTESVGPLTADTEFVLVCSGPGGQISSSVTVATVVVTPTVTFTATPSQVGFGGSSVFSWESIGTDGCQALGAWSGSKPASGSERIDNLETSGDYILLCTGPGGATDAAVNITVTDAPVPSLTLIAAPQTVEFGGSTVLSWTTVNADRCEAFGGWSGAQDTTGSFIAENLQVKTSFTLLCEGPGGNRAVTVSVNVGDAPLPVIEFEIEPNFISYGGAAVLHWSVTDAQSCVASGDWSGDKALSGTETVTLLFSTANFTLSCTGAGGSKSVSVSASVAALADMPLQDFEANALNTDPLGWLDTAPAFGTTELPSAFKIREVGGSQALAVTRNVGLDLHSHYVLDGAETWQDYRYTGRMHVAGDEDNVGVTVLSSMPVNAAYYRLGTNLTGNSFVLSNHGAGVSCEGDLDTGFQPEPGHWYRFTIEADSSGSATNLRARVWKDGQAEPAGWQAECTDSGAERLRFGTVGVWVSLQSPVATGAWDELLVMPINEPPVQPPVLTLSANPVAVSNSGFTTLSWSARNAELCTASGAWQGARSTAGNEQSPTLTQNSTFTLACSGPGGSIRKSVVVTVGEPSLPTVELTVTPDQVYTGESITLQWSSTDAEICSATGDWSGVRPVNGQTTITDVQQDKSFTLECIGVGGTAFATVDVLLADAIRDPAMVFEIVPFGLGVDGTVILAWRSEHTHTCEANGSWNGNRTLIGFEVVGPIEVADVYKLTCTGRGGSITQSIQVSYVDSDTDGMPDIWETAVFGSLQNNGLGDFDGDGLLDREEYVYGTDPRLTDTDYDGQSDHDEVLYNSDPRDVNDNYSDSAPQRPQVNDVNGASLVGFEIDASNGYQHPDGNPLSYALWQFALDDQFAVVMFDREIEGSTSVIIPAGVLNEGVSYFVRTRHLGASGAPSAWSETATVIAATAYPNDADGDGIDDDYQVPDNADSNNNGIADSDEGICNLYDAQGGSIIGITTNSGVARCYTSLSTAEVNTSSMEANMELPVGMFSFRVDGLRSDENDPAEVFVSIWLPESYDPKSGWQKYDEATGEVTDYSAYATFNGNRVTLHLIDGGEGDQDGVVNGVIVDPSGPFVAVAQAPVDPAPVNPAPVIPVTPPASGGGGGGAIGWPLMLLLAPVLYRRRQRR